MKIAAKARLTLILAIFAGTAMPSRFESLAALADEVSAKPATDAIDGLPEVTDETFRAKVLKSKLPVVVDFSAPWCGPCKLMVPVLKDLSKEFAGKVQFVSVDIDQSTHVALRYKVNALPTFFIFQGGKEKLLSIGLTKSDDLKKAIEDSIH
jgi:thioredoxin 1